jgi:hypothetical protein
MLVLKFFWRLISLRSENLHGMTFTVGLKVRSWDAFFTVCGEFVAFGIWKRRRTWFSTNKPKDNQTQRSIHICMHYVSVNQKGNLIWAEISLGASKNHQSGQTAVFLFCVENPIHFYSMKIDYN